MFIRPGEGTCCLTPASKVTLARTSRGHVRRMTADSMNDPDLGTLTWDNKLDWWEGSIRLSSEVPFQLHIFARASEGSERAITADARRAIERIRQREPACRRYAADQLLNIRNSEWSQGDVISAEEFMRRLAPDSVEIHETGYTEIHFGDDGLFLGHSVGVRIRSDGGFQEAVLEG